MRKWFMRDIMVTSVFKALALVATHSYSVINKYMYTAAPLYRGPIDRGNRYNAVVLCRQLLIKKTF